MSADFLEDKEQRSPFKPPNDEEVFVTRETEKAKKKEAKELLKNQRIWDKNTATSRAPLRRVKDTDIDAADYKDADGKEIKRSNAYSYNPQQNGMIAEAMQIARKRVQFPKESRELNMQEFIDQKKEMFHAELAYKNVQNEIALLEHKKGERQAALMKSQQELNDDHSALLAFIAADNKEKKEKETKEKLAHTKRQEKEETLKKLDMEIQQVRSDIDKHKDALNDLQTNQQFILELSPQEFRDERSKRVQEKRDEAFKIWKKRYLADESQDDIIFGEDEEIHDGIKLNQIDESTITKHATQLTQGSVGRAGQSQKRDTQRKVIQRATASDEWLAQRFDQLLQLDLIELPDEYYEDKLFFEGTDALDQKFLQLEEDNLFYIHRIQDIEQYLESTKDTIDRTHSLLDSKVAALYENRENLVQKIIEAQGSLEVQKKSSVGSKIQDQNSIMNPQSNTKNGKQQQQTNFGDMLNQIKKKIGELNKQNASKEPLQLLYDLENTAIKLVEQINVLKADEKTRDHVYRREKYYFHLYKDEKKLHEAAETRAEELRKQKVYLDRGQKVQARGGKIDAQRSEKIKLKKEQKKEVIDEKTKNYQTYLGDIAHLLLVDQSQVQQAVDGK